jgi:hypothetical protein
MTTQTSAEVAVQLDENHKPETNGRMAVCRRCGCRTDSALGDHHAPVAAELARAGQWLDGAARLAQADAARRARGA